MFQFHIFNISPRFTPYSFVSLKQVVIIYFEDGSICRFTPEDQVF